MSIEEHGLLQPVVVYRAADGRYKLIIGQRRLEASRLIDPNGTIKARVVRKPAEATMRSWSFAENFHRRELERKEIVNVIEYLNSKHNGDAGKVADILGGIAANDFELPGCRFRCASWGPKIIRRK